MINKYTEFINFFKKHGLYEKEMFDYFERKKELIGYHNKELENSRGLYCIYDNKKRLISLKLLIKHVDDSKTALMNIRPYIQAIHAYKNLGKKYIPNIESEILAIYYERLFIKENPDEELEKYLNHIYKSIEKSNTEYKIALLAQKELDEKVTEETSFKKLSTTAKKLTKKYKSKP